jgi:glycosyltransferase involved in cell wall biosynthesis
MELRSGRTKIPNLDGIDGITYWHQGRPLRALFVSDGIHTTSGYGKQALLAVAALHRLGVDVAALAAYGMHGTTMELPELPGVKIYSGGSDGFANDVLLLAARDWKADVVITLKDAGVYRHDVMQKVRWVGLTPIDHEPAPPMVQRALRQQWQPIAYAKNGFKQMRQMGLDPLYVPHAYDPAMFKPGSKQDAHTKLGWPKGKRVISTIAVNRGGLPSRKAWPQLMAAMGIVRRMLGEHCPMWYCHTATAEDGHEMGVNLLELAHQNGLQDLVFFPDQVQYRYVGYEDEYIANVYRASEFLLAVSVGEGFGVPIIEAQACGTPAMVGRWTAMEDLGFREPQMERQHAEHHYGPQQSFMFIPRPEPLAERIIHWLHTPMNEEQQQAMLEWVSEYEIGHVTNEHWRNAVETIDWRLWKENAHGRGVSRIIRPEEVLG